MQAVLCQAFCLIFGHAQVGVQRMEVFGHVATEVGRVVRVDGDFHAALEHVEDVVLGHVVEHAELGVGQRADGQRDLFVDDALHQSLVFNGAYTVVDALDLQQVQCFPDVFRRAFFSGVGDGQEALAAGAIKYALELARRVAHLGAIEAHGDERITERQRLIEGFFGFFLGQVTQEAQDQTAVDAQLRLAVFQRTGNPGQHHFKRDTTVGVGLRIEERFGVDNVLFLAAQQVSPGQVVEVLLCAQNVRTAVIQIKEFLQVVEGIGLAQGFDVIPRQGNFVALCQGEQQLGFQRTFEVQVQFCLGQGVQPVVHILFSSGADRGHSTDARRCAG
ncbi:hypothetical protein ALQ43_05327 [Pseudomonas savastanoi pv. glycinea]|nr:hypothetical protein ALQ43_05327 [Pseudomonas savastanoi pv. glycinea]RMU49583.1 hypothetical protein ALP27_05365 [Pseudomonas savastanoi pv. glycinea]